MKRPKHVKVSNKEYKYYMKITEYPKVANFDANDVLLKDGPNGTKTILIPDASKAFVEAAMPVEMHRNIYRGKNLGTSITTDQKNAIKNGDFSDMYIGDYWTLIGRKYVIADIDYWYNCGDTAFTKHHLVMIPDRSLYNYNMNDTNDTTGGYTGSKMYTEGLNQAKTIIQEAFGDLVLTHREYLTNAVSNGYPSAGAWFDSNVELMNEVMVYGSYIYTPGSTGSVTPTRYTIDKQQLALFKLNPKAINNRETIWLRDVVSSTLFARVADNGYASYSFASASRGVRPVFPVGVN